LHPQPENDDYTYPSRTDFAAARLREAIIYGDLEPGSRLTTTSLAKRWSVSQTPLREAFQRLAAAGLVELTDQKGARVSPIRQEELVEIFRLRVLLEPIALSRSMALADDEWRAHITANHRALSTLLKAGLKDKRQFDQCHHEFHTSLLGGCDWQWLLRILAMLTDNSRRYRMLSLAPRGGPRKLLAEHDELFKACIAGDVDKATAVLVEHLELTVQVLAD